MGDAQQGDQPGGKGAPVGALTPIVEGSAVGAATNTIASGVDASAPARMSAPQEIRLAGAASGVAGAKVEVTPAALTLLADPAGPLGRNSVSVDNGSNAEQMVWLSFEAPDLLSVTVEQTVPSRATLRVTVDLADAASRGPAAPTQARVYVTTPSETAAVTVSWKPLPYGRM